MGARSLVAGGLRWAAKAVEGGYRSGPYYLPLSGGWLPDGSPTNFWQLGYNVIPSPARSAMVEACVSAYAQTVAMCQGDQWRLNDKGGNTRVTNSAASRILRKPNAYQTASDFMLNAVRQLYLDGNAYALALRNSRFEVSELHLMDSRLCAPQLAVNGEVFYRLFGNSVIERETNAEPLLVPQRDVLHIRLHADRSRQNPFPLWGQSPLLAAMSDIVLSDSINSQQQQFYQNQARPSAVISTDLQLDLATVTALRDRWDEQSRGINQGKTPILTHGLKVNPWASPPRDAQIAEIMKVAEGHIALVFRIPLAVLGLGGSAGSTEALMTFWLATGLGFCLNHCEQAFERLLGLKGQPDEFIEFDTAALLRSDFKDRIRGLKEAVTGGILSPNEARNKEGLDDVIAGSEPRMQQQQIPLSFAAKMPALPGQHPAGPPAGPPAPGIPAATLPPTPKALDDDVRRAAQRLFDNAARINRRHLS